ncbi:MAG: pyridoxamine 5'-phosphate oxidase family protein [Cyanobacteria bacterium J06639_14]
MLNDNIRTSIRESVLCWLATVDSEGIPNVSPKEIFTEFGTNEIIIANIASPNSAKNIAKTPSVCVSFINVFTQKGYKIKGNATIFLPDQAGFDERYHPLYKLAGDKFPIHSVFGVIASKVSPIIAPRYHLYPGTSEQDQIQSAYRTYGVVGEG